jgi:excisionase family DNA binding protein
MRSTSPSKVDVGSLRRIRPLPSPMSCGPGGAGRLPALDVCRRRTGMAVEHLTDATANRFASPKGSARAVPERRLYRVPEAMQLLSMSRSVIYEQIRSGRLRSVCQGRARLIPAAAITDYVELLIAESQDSHGTPA